MSVVEDIARQMAADAAARAQGQPAPAGHPGPPAPQGWNPGAQPAPFPAAHGAHGAHVAPSHPMQPGFTFPGPAAPAPAPAPSHFGAPATPGWLHDGQGGYFDATHLPAMAQAGHPGAVALLTAAHAAAPVAPSPTPGLPPEAFAPGGPAGPPLPTQPAPTGAPVPPPIGVSTPEAKGPGRPKGSKNRAGDTDPAPPPAVDAWDRIAAALERIATKIGA